MTAEEYARSHKEAFRTAFDFLNTHFPPGEDPDWWDGTAKDGQLACAKCGENKLTTGLLIGVFEYLEDEWTKRRKDREGTDN